MTDSPASPLYRLLNEINIAAKSNLGLIAITAVAALPDICVSLLSDDGRSDASRYKKWCEENLTPDYFRFVTPEDLYSFRCGVLHNGRFGDLTHNVARIIFAIDPQFAIVDNKLNDAYFYSLMQFCMNFTKLVFHWSERHRNHPNMISNLDRFMQYRPNGMAPYVQGTVVIA